VVNSASLGEVDLLALEHVIAKLLNLCLLGKLDKQGKGLLGNEVLGEIEQDVVAISLVLEGVAELAEALGVCEDKMLGKNDLMRLCKSRLTLSELLLQHNGATEPVNIVSPSCASKNARIKALTCHGAR
jgi:hypothetical protein